ncbi:MAG: N4-gp56 family major capsid protein [Clostridiales bacterium]|nr:N4-gp56 family major capsid protein [Clostridiales bacterium]
MSGGINLASKYSKSIDERFYKESQAALAVNNDYEFTGVKTVNVYSIPAVAMSDYSRSGTARYGTPNDLSRNVQSLTVSRDRAFTFIIDKGDKLQSMKATDAGKALNRQIREVIVPEYDAYVFRKLAAAATAIGNTGTAAITAENAYECLLAGQEKLGDRNVPDRGRVCFCSYRFANLLKRDSSFVRYGDSSQELLKKGVIGEVDGTKIVKVPASRLPSGCAFLLVHPMAATAPKQLEEYKIHDNPPGISGFLVEGRCIYDCFVLDEKAYGIYYHGEQGVLRPLDVSTSGAETGKANVMVVPGVLEASGNKWYYQTAETAEDFSALSYGTAITTSAWTVLAASGAMITPNAGHKYIRVIETDAAGKPIAAGESVLHIG